MSFSTDLVIVMLEGHTNVFRQTWLARYCKNSSNKTFCAHPCLKSLNIMAGIVIASRQTWLVRYYVNFTSIS